MQQALAFSLAICLTMPNPALALRQAGLEENSAKQEFLNRLDANAGIVMPVGAGMEEEEKEKYLKSLRTGKVYMHPTYGPVELLEVLVNEDAVVIRRKDLPTGTGQLYAFAKGRGQRISVRRDLLHPFKVLSASQSPMVLLYNPNTGDYTEEALNLVQQKARAMFEERFVPLLFGLSEVAERMVQESEAGIAGYYTDVFGRTAQTYLPVPGYDLERAWSYIDNAEEEPPVHRFFQALFKTILLETGEDVVLSGVLNSFGREEQEDRSKAWPHTWPGSGMGTSKYTWGSPRQDVRGIPAYIDSYYRGQILKRGLRAFFKETTDVTVSDAEYREAIERYNLFLRYYYRKRDPRHAHDPFSQLILRVKGDVSVVGQIAPLVAQRLQELRSGPLSSVDLIVPMPAPALHRNQTIPLADVVSRGLDAPLSLSAIRQIRLRRKQPKTVRGVWRQARNAGGLFVGDRGELYGKDVVVVDDNETTGLTAASVRAAAMAAGARRVYVLSFGRTERGPVKSIGQVAGSPHLGPALGTVAGEAIPYSSANVLLIILGSNVAIQEKMAAFDALLQDSSDAMPLIGEIVRSLETSWSPDEAFLFQGRLRMLEVLRQLVDQGGPEVQTLEPRIRAVTRHFIEEYITEGGWRQDKAPMVAAALRVLGRLRPIRNETVQLLMDVANIETPGRRSRAEVVAASVEMLGGYGEAATSAVPTLEIIIAKASGQFAKGGHGVELSIATMEALARVVESARDSSYAIPAGTLAGIQRQIEANVKRWKHTLTVLQKERIERVHQQLFAGGLEETNAGPVPTTPILEGVKFYNGLTEMTTGATAPDAWIVRTGLEEGEALVAPGQRRAVVALPDATELRVNRLFIHPDLPWKDFAGLEEVRLPADAAEVPAFLLEVEPRETDLIVLPLAIAPGQEASWRQPGGRTPILVISAAGLEEANSQVLAALARIARNLEGQVLRVGLEEWSEKVLSWAENLMSISY